MSEQNRVGLEIAVGESGTSETQTKLVSALKQIQQALGLVANVTETLNEANEDANQTTRSLSQTVDALSGTLRLTGEELGPLGSKFVEVANGLGGISAAAGPIAAVTTAISALSAASVVVIQKLFEISSGVAEVAQETDDFQRFVGISRDLAAALELGGKAIGATVGDLKDGLAQFKGVLNEAAEGADEQREALERLGATDFNNLENALNQIATKLASSGDAARGLSIELNKAFGEEGSRQFEPILKSLVESKRRAEEFGLVIKEDLLKQAADFRSVIADIEAQAEGATNILGGRFLQSFTELGKIVSSTINQLRQDEGFTTGLENLASLIDRIITGPLPQLVTLTADLIEFSGQFAGFISVLAISSNDLEKAIAKLPTTVDTTIAKIKDLTKETLTASQAFSIFENELNKLQKIREVNNQGLDAVIQQRINEIDALEKQGVKSAIEAANEKNQILLQQAERQKEQAENDLAFLRDSLSTQIKTRQEAIENTNKQESIALEKKQQQQEVYDEIIKALETRRQKFLQDLNNQSSRLTEEQFNKNKALAEADFQNQLKNNQTAQKIKEGLARLDNEIATAQARRINTENQIAGLQQKFADQDLALRAKREQAEAKADETRRLNIERTEQALVKTNQTRIASINEAEKKATQDLQNQLLLRQINEQQYNETVLANKIRFDKQRLESEQGTLIKLNDLEGASAETKTAIRQEIADRRLGIATNEADQEIQISERVIAARLNEIEKEAALRSAALERRKAEIAQIKDLDLQRIQQSRLEIDILLEGVRVAQDRVKQEELQLKSLRDKKATNEEIALQEARIAQAVAAVATTRAQANAAEKAALNEKIALTQKALQLQQQEFANIEALADRSNSAVAALKGGLVAVGESFDIASQSTEQLQDRILQLEGNIKFLREQVVAPGIDVFINENLRSIDKLNTEIFNRTQKAIFEQEQARLKAVQETNSAIVENLNDALEEQEEAQQEHTETVNDLRQEIKDNEQEINDEIVSINQESLDKIQEIKDKANEQAQRDRDKEAEKVKSDLIKLNQEIEEIQNKAGLDRNDQEQENIVDRAKLEKDLAEQNAALLGAKTDQEKQRAQAEIDRIKAELAKISNLSKSADDRDKKIADAQAEFAKETEGNITEEQLKAAEERLKAKIDAANQEFSDAEKFQQKLLELQKLGATKEIEQLKAKEAEKQKLRDQALATELKNIESNLARQKELRDKAEAEKQAEIDKQIEEEKKRGQEAIDRLKEEGSKRKEEIKNQIKAENREFEAAEKERNEKIARAIAEVSAGLQIASSQLSDYVTNLAKSLGLAADKIKPIADAIAQINNATNTGSPSSSSSNPSSPSSPNNNNSGNIFSSPNQGNNNGSAGNLGNFRQQAPNSQNNQGSQSNNQQGNSPNAPPSSPDSSPAGPSSNTGNASISASPNQANQNSEVEPTGGQIDDTVPKSFASSSEYRAAMVKLHKSLLDSLGLKADKLYKTLGGFKAQEVKAKAKRKGNELTYIYGRGFGIEDKAINSSLVAVSFLNYGSAIVIKKDGGFRYSYKDSQKTFETGLDKLISLLEAAKPTNPLDEGLDDTATPASPGSNPGDVNAPSNPNQPGGRGNNPSPRSPGSTNPKATEPPGLSDKEKAFFANQEKEKNTGFDESEESGLAARRRLRPDQAVKPGGNNPDEPDLTNPTSPEAPAQPSQAPTISNQNNIEFRPQFTINLPANRTANSGSNTDINQVMSGIARAVSDVANVQGREFMQAINQEVQNYLDKMFS